MSSYRLFALHGDTALSFSFVNNAAKYSDRRKSIRRIESQRLSLEDPQLLATMSRVRFPDKIVYSCRAVCPRPPPLFQGPVAAHPDMRKSIGKKTCPLQRHPGKETGSTARKEEVAPEGRHAHSAICACPSPHGAFYTSLSSSRSSLSYSAFSLLCCQTPKRSDSLLLK